MNYFNKNDFNENKKEKSKVMILIEQKLKDIKKLDYQEIYPPESFINNLATEKEFKDEKIKINQIRNIYDLFLKAKNYSGEKRKRELLQIYPQIAYAKGRKLITDEFYTFVKLLVDQAKNDDESFEKAFEIYKTLIAYLKYHAKR
ncbi:MAG: type III-A CRISPR-associated protein Csm2 [Candidatus Woesearchaeota archaeon]